MPSRPVARRVVRPRQLIAGALLVSALVVGCGRGDDSHAADTSHAAPAAPATPAVMTHEDSVLAACPMEGAWQMCSVENRLRKAGLAVVPDSTPVRQPFLDVSGTTFHLGATSTLQVFVYPTATAREKDLAGVDTVSVQAPGSTVTWPMPPTLIVSNNLAAILLSQNARQIERVQLAITAGLPAPAPDKKR